MVTPRLEETLRRQNNNADLFRLLAACAVIWGHAYAIAPRPGRVEPIGAMLGFDYSGSLAVKFFFFLSGILIADSWIRSPDSLRFVLARAFRIFPALFVNKAICIFIVGAAFTTIPLQEYFSNTWMYYHILHYPHGDYVLPGVFSNHASASVNGALWTIRYELLMYALVLAAGLCGLFRHRALCGIALGTVIVAFSVRPEWVGVFGLGNENNGGQLVAIFCAGSLLALYKDKISIGPSTVGGLVLFAWLLRSGPLFPYAFCAAFLASALWLMTTPIANRLRLPGDFSYGVYIFGWPIQQAMVELFPHSSPHTNQLLSIPAAIVIGAASWYCIEEPCMKIGRGLPGWASRLRLRQHAASRPAGMLVIAPDARG